MGLKFWLTNSRTNYVSNYRNGDVYQKLKQDTVSDENADETMPYMNGSGSLCFIGKIYLFEMQNNYSWTDIDPTDKYLKADSYVMVNASDNYCNLRTGAGIKYDIITPVYNGTILPVVKTAYSQEDGLNWGKTEYSGHEGWISLSQTSPVSPE